MLLGDNSDCKVTGIGNISLKIHDGVDHLFWDMRYVP